MTTPAGAIGRWPASCPTGWRTDGQFRPAPVPEIGRSVPQSSISVPNRPAAVPLPSRHRAKLSHFRPLPSHIRPASEVARPGSGGACPASCGRPASAADLWNGRTGHPRRGPMRPQPLPESHRLTHGAGRPPTPALLRARARARHHRWRQPEARWTRGSTGIPWGIR